MPEVLQKLLSSRRVWLAFVAWSVTMAGVVFPQLSPQVVQATQTFATILIVTMTIDDGLATLKAK